MLLLGVPTAYTPTTVNIALGSGGSITGRVSVASGRARVRIVITFGAGFAVGSAYVGLPPSALPSGAYLVGSRIGQGAAVKSDGSNGSGFNVFRSGNYGLLLNVTATVPLTLAAGDRLELDLDYEL